MANGNARDTLNMFLATLEPWNKDIQAQASQHANEQTVTNYRAVFGKPGEPRYEQMMNELAAEFKRGRMTQEEKEAARMERKRQREYAMALRAQKESQYVATDHNLAGPTAATNVC